MIKCLAVMGRHRASPDFNGYITAWTGDLNADLPTEPLPLPLPLPIPMPAPLRLQWETPDMNLLRRVLHGLQRL